MWSTTSQHDVSFSRDVIYITAFLLSLLISKTKQNKKMYKSQVLYLKEEEKMHPKNSSGQSNKHDNEI